MEWLVKIWEHIAGEWRVIAQAPVLFGAAIVVGIGAVTFVIAQAMDWRYGGVEANLQSTVTTQQATISQLQEQLRGTSPQLAAIQAGRDRIRKKLQEFYVQGGTLFNRPSVNGDALKTYNDETVAWATSIGKWTQENMGDAAASRIFDPGSGTGVMWNGFNSDQSNIRNYIVMIRRNLSSLIETAAWDGSIPKNTTPN